MENRICKILGIVKPVIQRAMVWLTDAKLVAAVGNAGGMGVLGPNAGQTVVTRNAAGTAENMRAEIRKVRELTDAPFAVNVPPTQGREDIYTPPMLKVIYEEEVPAVVFVGEPDEAMFEELKEAVLKANAKDLLLFRTIPAYYRSLPGKLANELVAMDKAGATNEELGRKMGGFANLRIGMIEGDMDKGYVSVGNGISHIHRIKNCAEIIAELTRNWQG